MSKSDAGQPPEAGGRGAFRVAAGILSSRLVGLVREKVFAHYFGSSLPAAAFKAAMRIPNFLQNLFGEGVLSASFIPVYAQLIGSGEREEADRVAGAVFGILALVSGIFVAVGLVAAPLFVALVAPGFHGETRELTIQLVRVLFPGTALLVLSAWCLGILNSHRRFFLSYSAPVIWSCAQIAMLLAFGRNEADRLAVYVALGVVLGSVLQFTVQLPSVLRLLGRFRPTLSAARSSVQRVLRNFLPVLLGRGVVQISAFLDTAYGSLISERVVASLAYAQTLYLIPISLFGMSVSAAELLVMSQAQGDPEQIAATLRARINGGLARIAFFVVPSAAAFLFLGDVLAAVLFQGGKFSASDTRYLWYLLIGSTVGLLAATMGRLYSSAFYALKDTHSPLKYAILRVALTAFLAYLSAVKLPALFGIPRELGGVGITATTGLAAWLEFLLLRRRLVRRIGPTGVERAHMIKLWACAALAAGVGLAIKESLVYAFGVREFQEWNASFLPPPALPPTLTAVSVVVPFGAIYLGLTYALRIPPSRTLVRSLMGSLAAVRSPPGPV